MVTDDSDFIRSALGEEASGDQAANGPTVSVRAGTQSRRKCLAEANSNALLLDVSQCAEMIGVSRSQFWKLHSQGKVPLPVRLSARVVRWRKSELQQWVQAGCPARDKWISPKT